MTRNDTLNNVHVLRLPSQNAMLGEIGKRTKSLSDFVQL